MFKIKPLHLSIIIALITIVMMYLDSALFDSNKSILTYIKNVILCTGLSMGVFKIFCTNNGNQSGGSYMNQQQYNQISEPMYHGMPSNY